MPRFTLETSEDRRQFCEGPSRAGPKLSVISAGSPSGAKGAGIVVHGLFRSAVAGLGLLMLWCVLTLAAEKAQSRVEVAANNAFVAGSRALGHLAKAVSPVSDARHVVIRRSE